MPEQNEIDAEAEYSRLYDEHQDCERRLDELQGKSSLSEEDELAAKQIKRHKLFLKDRMEELARTMRATPTLA
jgi:hypothetical protein